ncbi:MAG: hypothetical protein IJG51_12250 [Synergistaceae bacterium]|nr:hypothetical protein [Synergistaceae bacterium]MBQ3399653.1 hypothetical protein [Synergistaceae bacterium]MBQ6417455.1 hypothetical protein [Synergistaceae bacterium]MBQ6666073.1 hypothetical protein [Synergistaceae bacterium]MBR0248005.1 hypothetical protein [Synergistaceae bacterium]
MKRSLAAVLAAVLAATMAFAGVQDFGEFKVDVPAGWTATKDGETVGIVKDDNTASMSITVDSTDGASLKELADAFVGALNGKNLKQDGESYKFDFDNGNGVKSEAVIVTDSGKYALFVITGRDNAPNDVAAIINSLQ